MTIIAYLLLAWLAVSACATFAWVAFIEVCRYQERRYLSGSGLPVGNGNPARNPEPDTTLLAVVDATRPTRRTERRASHPYTSPDDQERATARTLRIVP